MQHASIGLRLPQLQTPLSSGFGFLVFGAGSTITSICYRCAYSCQHLKRAGGLKAMEIDHFNPHLKGKLIQQYANLFLATRHCNAAKGDAWPTRAEQRLGLRFLNPCVELDYGEHIFEDPVTHLLVGVTPAGRFHIRMLDLNADHFVAERRERTEIRQLLANAPFTLRTGRSPGSLADMVSALRKQVQEMIPELPFLPRDKTC